MLYDDFKSVVDLVLNNWTALQLAVEHGMGAPGGEKTAQLMSVYITQYCIDNTTDVDNLTEILEDLMDEEFETVCHDDSPKEVASTLLLYLGLLREGRHQELRQRIEAMPKCQKWLSQPVYDSIPPQTHGNPDDDTTSSSNEDDEPGLDLGNSDVTNSKKNINPEPMEEDSEPGWTVVRGKRK